LRRECAGDESAIAAVHAAAFRRANAPKVAPPEVKLVADLRGSEAWLPALSIVAIVDGEVAGHVVCSRAMIGDQIPVLGLGPLGVTPHRQGGRVGTALMHAVIAAADARDERLIGLLGSVAYYARFGFVAARGVGVLPPHDWYDEHFQVRPLTHATGEERGQFNYAAAFDEVP
jgi:putative acetyltransferase